MQKKTTRQVCFAAFGVLAIGAAAIFGGQVHAGTMATDVKIIDGEVAKALTAQSGDVASGAKAFKNRKLGNCLACHENADMAKEPFHGIIGPPLDGVADRYSAAELRAIIVNPKAVFGDETIMPAFYRVMDSDKQRVAKNFQGKTILEAQHVEDIIAYLLTLK